MIIYEVNIELDTEIISEFNEWLDEHINKMLQFEGFKSAKKLNSIKDEQYFLTVQYNVDSQEDLDRYLGNYADQMRMVGFNKFGNKFKAHRRIMNTIKTYPN